jgi:hypothetical protein
MKSFTRVAVYLLWLSIIVLTACKKDPVEIPLSQLLPPEPPRPPIPPFAAIHDVLSGREYKFDDLVWRDERVIYVEVPNSIAFMNRGIEVSIISSATEIAVPFYTFEYPDGTFPFPAHNGYVYDNNWFEDLFVFAIGASKQLVGTKVSIKVKVL